MAKIKTVFFCQNCGAQTPKWIGRCPTCGEWNTYVEEVIHKKTAANSSLGYSKNQNVVPVPITEVQSGKEEERMNTLNQEFNRVLGGGLVYGSIILVGGEPGIGKSIVTSNCFEITRP